jgi:hypothetical protein
MIVMRVGQYDGAWCNCPEPAEPVRAAIDHDAGVAAFHQQRAMASMPLRPNVDLATGAEER